MSTELMIAIGVAIIGWLSGAWGFVQFLIQRKQIKKEDLSARLDKVEATVDVLKSISLGVLYDRAKYLGEKYIERGSITVNEYNDYVKYLYAPYHKAGGNGTIDKIMEEINDLPIQS